MWLSPRSPSAAIANLPYLSNSFLYFAFSNLSSIICSSFCLFSSAIFCSCWSCSFCFYSSSSFWRAFSSAIRSAALLSSDSASTAVAYVVPPALICSSTNAPECWAAIMHLLKAYLANWAIFLYLWVSVKRKVCAAVRTLVNSVVQRCLSSFSEKPVKLVCYPLSTAFLKSRTSCETWRRSFKASRAYSVILMCSASPSVAWASGDKRAALVIKTVIYIHIVSQFIKEVKSLQ